MPSSSPAFISYCKYLLAYLFVLFNNGENLFFVIEHDNHNRYYIEIKFIFYKAVYCVFMKIVVKYFHIF